MALTILSRSFTAVRSLIYSAAFIGLWIWVATYLRRFDARIPFSTPRWLAPVGVVIACLGGLVAATCIAAFAAIGRGTPAPFDPPRQFVASGPYRYVRNPMYLGAAAVILGVGLVVSSPAVILLTPAFLLAMHLFVTLHEEHSLADKFGDSYLRYKATVHRWMVQRPKPNGPPGAA